MMEVQKRQTHDTCERLQKHLEKCLDIVKVALTDLPSQYDISPRLNLREEKNKKRKRNEAPIPPGDMDRVMCDIADNL